MIFGNPPIVTNGLVLHLDAGSRQSYVSGSTTWRDLSGQANNGTLTASGSGAVSASFDSANQGSIVFSGTGSYTNCGNSTLLNSSNITFSAWVKRTATWNNGTSLFWAKANGNFASNGFYIELATTSAIGGGFLPTTVITNGAATNYFRTSINSNTSFALNTWTHFVFTLTGSTPAMYFNGVAAILTIGGTNAITPTSDTKYLMHSSPLYAGYTIGNIAQVQIYNRSLSATEVAQNYNALKSRFGLS